MKKGAYILYTHTHTYTLEQLKLQNTHMQHTITELGTRLQYIEKDLNKAQTSPCSAEQQVPTDVSLQLDAVPASTCVVAALDDTPKIISQTMAPVNSNLVNSLSWSEVVRKPSRRAVSIHGAAGPNVTSLKAVEVRKHLHLWNMESTADEIQKYLYTLCNTDTCTVQELTPKGNYKSFKIGVPLACFEKCYSADVWPMNARIKPWIYYRKSTATNKDKNQVSTLPRENHDIVAATETFLDSSVGDMEVSSYDWSVLRRDRGTPCGGVLIAARAPILLRRRPELETTDGEDLWASFTWRGRAMYVCVVYIKPSAKDADYMKWFTKIEAFINSVKGIFVPYNKKLFLLLFMSFCGLNEKNNLKNLHGGVLDVALFRESEEVQDVIITATEGIVYPDAYHPPLDIQVRIDTVHGSNLTEPSNIDISRDWNFKKCNYDLLSSLLAEQSWDCVTMSDNIHEATQNFYITLYKLFDICVSKNRRQKGKNRLYPVWFTKDIIQDIRRKSRLHSAWKRTGCAEAYRNFSDIRANLKIRVKSSYEIYMKRIGAEIKTNPREFWRHISNLRSKGGFEPTVTHKGESLTGIQAAEAFASFFSSLHGYYPFMYPTKFLLGTLGYNSLEVRRNCDQIGTMCKILHGKILATELHEKLTRLFVPNNYCRSRKHKLFAVPACCTVARANSPIPRSLAALNALLDGTDCDIFADEWKKILSVCLKYCEKSV
ncbi:hypothetical protein SFRURICE_004049 [Spodoptera frugiperda]|nr:hypothetical protein SFRURICE_004049 [Spodoptera frugiperda]